jgi:hypothetical protein
VTNPSSCGCKIGHDTTKYDVPDLPTFIKRHRIGADSNLRDLTDAVNIRLIEAVLDRTDADVAGNAGSVHTALADEDTPPERRLSVPQPAHRCRRRGRGLEEDFVFY